MAGITGLVACGLPGPGPIIQPRGTIVTVAGGLGEGNATDVALAPIAIAVDGSTAYAADYGLIRAIDLDTGDQEVIAGTGHWGTSGDGGPATEARVMPGALDIDPEGNVVFLDTGSSVRRVDRGTGTIETLFGAPQQAPGPHVLGSAWDLTVDSAGNIFVADGNYKVIRWDAATGAISVVAGQGAPGEDIDGIPAIEAGFGTLGGIVADDLGNVYVAETQIPRVHRIDPDGILHTVAGQFAGPGPPGDGGPATEAHIGPPSDLAIAPDGDLLLNEQYGQRIRRIDSATGVISTAIGAGEPGFSGDGGPALAARFRDIQALAVDPAGDGTVLIADSGNARARRVDGVTGVVSTVAGNGSASQSGDGGPALEAQLGGSSGLAVDRRGNLYLSDGSRVRRVDRATRSITTVAGGGASGSPGDGGPARDATLASADGLAVDRRGNLFVADPSAGRVRRIDAGTGVITTVAGTGAADPAEPPGEGVPATEANLRTPSAVAVAPDGTLYVSAADGIYRVDPQGILTTAPGGADVGASGLMLDGRGGLYATDGWMTVRRIDLTTGESTVVAEIRGLPGPGDGDDIIQPSGPQGMALGADGTVFVALWFDRRVVSIDPASGEVTPVAGTGVIDHGGDGGPAVDAALVLPNGLAIDGRGNLYISDSMRIRRVARVAPPG